MFQAEFKDEIKVQATGQMQMIKNKNPKILQEKTRLHQRKSNNPNVEMTTNVCRVKNNQQYPRLDQDLCTLGIWDLKDSIWDACW
jgi:hypothetical protein